MLIIVCVKSVPVSDAIIRLIPDPPYIDRVNLKYDLNPYDEYALEAAVQLKEQVGGRVIALAVTDEFNRLSLKRTLALGADQLIELQIPTVGLNDPISIAKILAEEIGQHSFDLIFLGKQAIDTGYGATGAILSHFLNIPLISGVTSLEFTAGNIVATKELTDCQVTLQCPLPAVLTAEKGLNKPRCPSLKDLMRAKQKEVITKAVSAPISNFRITRLIPPPTRPAGKIMPSGPEAVSTLIAFLKTHIG